MIDVATIKKQFPIFQNHPNLVYLDTSATSLKPQVVVQKLREYYEMYTANIHRGLYRSAEKSTEEFEQTRDLTAKSINSSRPDEIIFTRNATESINLVAQTISEQLLEEGDEVVVTVMEHHSNFVPWQQLALKKKAKFVVIPINNQGILQLYNSTDQSINQSLLKQYINDRTKILAFVHVSNTLGTINPVAEIIKQAKQINPKIVTIIDAAQSVPHMAVDVQAIGCDFFAFSSHKMLGPTGVGVLWGRYDLLEKMPPYQYGGNMIEEVTLERTTFQKPPNRFEAGTPHIAGVIALKAAITFLQQIGLENVRNHEKQLTVYALKRLKEVFGEEITIHGPEDVNIRGGVVSFNLRKYHPHDIAQILDEDEICVRAGHHCTMPLHQHLQTVATARASFYLYNNEDDVEKLVKGLQKVIKILK